VRTNVKGTRPHTSAPPRTSFRLRTGRGPSREIRRRLRRAPIYALILTVCTAMIFPLYWMFATAVRPKGEIFSRDLLLWPSELVWQNFIEAWTARPFNIWYVNSIGIAVIACAITVSINLLAGYTFAKLQFVGRNVLFIVMISTLMIPVQVVMIPNFLLVASVGMLNTWWAVILPRSAEAFGIFMVRQFMLSIPDELLEAARVDGAGEFRIFIRIVLPLSGPVVAVLSIFTFMWRWNDFAWPIVVLLRQESYTVPLGLNLFQGQFATEWSYIMAMALVSIIPMLVIFIVFQRYFVEGIAASGVKG
jgi:alpha-1,4-digalacturonate transport system permease protein